MDSALEPGGEKKIIIYLILHTRNQLSDLSVLVSEGKLVCDLVEKKNHFQEVDASVGRARLVPDTPV